MNSSVGGKPSILLTDAERDSGSTYFLDTCSESHFIHFITLVINLNNFPLLDLTKDSLGGEGHPAGLLLPSPLNEPLSNYWYYIPLPQMLQMVYVDSFSLCILIALVNKKSSRPKDVSTMIS
jgi:hypothetical protein